MMTKSKYRNKKTEVDGLTFDSKAEATRYLQLKMLERSGHINDLKLQVPFELAPSVVIKGRKRPAMKYVADFVYEVSGKNVVEDCKGMVTAIYSAKRHLMKSVHGIDILETRA